MVRVSGAKVWPRLSCLLKHTGAFFFSQVYRSVTPGDIRRSTTVFMLYRVSCRSAVRIHLLLARLSMEDVLAVFCGWTGRAVTGGSADLFVDG